MFYISGFRDLSIHVTYTCHQERYCLKVTGLRVILLPSWQVCITDIHCWNMLYLIYFIKRFILKISSDSTTKQDTKHQTNSDHSLLVLVKALVGVLYEKYSMRGGVEKVIPYSTKQSQVLYEVLRLHLSAIFHYSKSKSIALDGL